MRTQLMLNSNMSTRIIGLGHTLWGDTASTSGLLQLVGKIDCSGKEMRTKSSNVTSSNSMHLSKLLQQHYIRRPQDSVQQVQDQDELRPASSLAPPHSAVSVVPSRSPPSAPTAGPPLRSGTPCTISSLSVFGYSFPWNFSHSVPACTSSSCTLIGLLSRRYGPYLMSRTLKPISYNYIWGLRGHTVVARTRWSSIQ